MTDVAAYGSRLERWTWWLLWGHALCLPISIALAQPMAFLIGPCWLWLAWRQGRRFPSGWPCAWPMLAFVICAIASAFLGARPLHSLDKADRLLLLGVALALPALGVAGGAAGEARSVRFLLLFVLGSSLQAAADFVRIPWQYVSETRAFDAMLAAGSTLSAHRPTIYDMGNMRDPQFYMVALCVILGLLLHRRPGLSVRWLAVALGLNAVALLAHFKRGAWLSFIVAVACMALLSGRRRTLALVLVGAAAALALPQVQERLGQVREEFQIRQGGRYVLWTRVAPQLLEEYPWGIGWRATEHADLTRYGYKVQRKLNHLHDNLLEVALETGWAGAAAWLAWMATALAAMARVYRWARRGSPDWAGASLGVCGGFIALLANGLVEYNFGDGEIFMLFTLLLAASAVTWQVRRRAAPAGPGPARSPAMPAAPPATQTGR